MNHTTLYKYFMALWLLTGLSISMAEAQVITRDTTFLWKHFEYSLDEYNGMQSYNPAMIVEEPYRGVVIENEYVRLVVLPEFGARVASFFFKPSGHEQFYINPVGTPYGMDDGNFYYDWLMVFGGVFPTFPEPEHGKTWFLPWQWEITENSGDVVSLRMELQDTINYPFHPGKFNNGVTEIRCITEITLRKGMTSFEMEHTLQNTKAENIPFEYWTCTTLAPGSDPGNTFTPENSEIIAPIELVYLKDDWWSWMGQAEVPAPGYGDHVFEFRNLGNYGNWDDMGIAYAYPAIEAGYYGVINHENEEGVFRVSDNAGVTKGMKFWTWGALQGLNADPENFYETARPYIELWSGLSTQFFENAYLSPGGSVTWTETYLPTLSMEQVSKVNESGAIFLGHTHDDLEQFNIRYYTTAPGYLYQLEVSLTGNSSYNLYDDDFIAESSGPSEFILYIQDYSIEEGDYILGATIRDQAGEVLLECTQPVTLPYSSQGLPSLTDRAPTLYRLSDGSVRLEFMEDTDRLVEAYSLSGQLIFRENVRNNSVRIAFSKEGVYIIRITREGRTFSLKIMI